MARIQDLGLLHALKYEPVLRAGLAAHSFATPDVNEILLETYTRVLVTGECSVTDVTHIGALTLRTASTAAQEWRLKKRWRSRGSVLPDNGLLQAFETMKTSPLTAAGRPDAAAIAAIVDRLPPQSREVLRLHKAKRLRLQDIARKLHVSEMEVTRRMLVAIREYAILLLASTGVPL